MIHIMLYFLYHYNYAFEDGGEELIVHALVYAIADKYRVDGLAKLAEGYFMFAFEERWNSHEMQSAIRLVYSSTPPQARGLRDLVLKGLTIDDNHKFKESMKIPGFAEMMEDVGEFSRDLAVKIAGAPSGPPQAQQG